MGQRLNIHRDFGTVAPDFVKLRRAACIRPPIRLFQFHGEERKPLADVVVQFSGYPGAFFLLSFDQLATHFLQRFLCQLLVCDVGRRADKAGKRAIPVPPRRRDIQHPAVHSIPAAKPVFLGILFLLFECTLVRRLDALYVIRVNEGRPGVSKSGCHVAASEVNPPVIQIVDRAFLVAHPDQGGCSIRHQPEAFFAFTQTEIRLAIPGSLPQQANDQHRLNEDQQEHCTNIFSVTFPQAWLPIGDNGARRKRRFRNVPTPEPAPIHVNLRWRTVHDGNFLRSFSQ